MPAKEGAALATEGREMHEVARRHRFDRISGFAPGREAAHDDKRVESLLPQQMRHTGAGGFARSSTVQKDVLVPGEFLEFLGEIIGLDSNRAGDAGGAGIVVTVAAHIDEQNLG